MRRRRVLPSRDPPVRACTAAPCRRGPRRISLAASAAGARSLGAVAAAFWPAGHRRGGIRGMFNQSLSGQGPLNATLDAAARRMKLFFVYMGTTRRPADEAGVDGAAPRARRPLLGGLRSARS